ncbi:MAG: SMP-30/gluconolactonase/LRE family protein [Thermoguttaceae bacterium]|nr:SMP-30/gluconolactonase/LRE family protein [Thermoguttaceae bacterium]
MTKRLETLGVLFGLAALLMVGCAKQEETSTAAKQDSGCPYCDACDGHHHNDVAEIYKNARPSLFLNLGDDYYNPDGMAVDAERGVLWLNVPNFSKWDDNKVKANSHQGGYLLSITKDGTVTKKLEYPIFEKTGQTGPMGLEFGPDGNLYACDNQAFYDDTGVSRILRVVMQDGEPTGEVQTVVEGVALANGIRWTKNLQKNYMFYTDSILPFDQTDEVIGAGGVFGFTADEVFAAGKDGNPPITVTASKDDPHCVAYQEVYKVGRGDSTGCDGITVDNDGNVWFGNFGNGTIYALRPDENGQYKKENVECVFDSRVQPPAQSGPYKGLKLECCDGIFFDAGTGLIFLDDSVNNAVWAFAPVAKGEKVTPKTIWKNGDTDGLDGQLDQPAEAIVFDGKLIVVAFDMPWPGMVNSATEGPGTISAINMDAILPIWNAPAEEADSCDAGEKCSVEKAADAVAEKAAEVKEAVEEAAENAAQKAGEVTEEVKEKAADAADAVQEKAAEVKEAVEQAAENVSEKAEEVVEAVKEKAADAADAVQEKAAEVKDAVEQAADTAAQKAEEVVEAVKEKAADTAEAVEEKYRPFVYCDLPDDFYGPDAQCYVEATKTLYLSVPNFLNAGDTSLPETTSYLLKINPDGTAEKLFEFPIYPGEVKIGAMGIDMGPDGNLYVCDNQYFFDTNFKSRLWRLVMKDGVPTGDLQLVMSGIKVANAIMWDGDKVFVTDTILDEEGKYGSGGVWCFSAEEILKAGTDEEHPPIAVTQFTGAQRDERLIIVEDAEDVRGNNCGADGICKGNDDIYYFGNYGDGAFYRFRFDADGKPEVQKIHRAGELFRCVDGICFDKKTSKIYITDSADNSIWSCEVGGWDDPYKFEKLWENDDTDGTGGLLDLPCECRVVDGILTISNQDMGVGETGKCQATDKPYTLSGIKLY